MHRCGECGELLRHLGLSHYCRNCNEHVALFPSDLECLDAVVDYDQRMREWADRLVG